MADFLLQLVYHPYATAAIAFSLGGAIAFFIFCAGFFGSMKQLIKIDMGAEPLEHARTRAMWGVILMAFFFLVWETVRAVASALDETIEPISFYTVGALWGVALLGYLIFRKPAK